MVQPQVQTPPGGKYSPGRAEASHVAVGWTNDGNPYLIDWSLQFPHTRRLEPDEVAEKP